MWYYYDDIMMIIIMMVLLGMVYCPQFWTYVWHTF